MADKMTLESPDPSIFADYEELINRIEGRPIPENPVIFYGSSSFRLWDPTLLKDLESDSIVNLAFGGSTLVSCSDFFEEIMKPYEKPKSMVIYAGDNDLGQGKSAIAVKNGFLRVLTKVENRFGQIPVFFVSIKPSPSKQAIFDRISESNRLIHEESLKRDNLHYIDIFTPMLSAVGNSSPEYFVEDMLHMNRAGYQVWSNTILDWREEIGF